jgi:hypothetical protein
VIIDITLTLPVKDADGDVEVEMMSPSPTAEGTYPIKCHSLLRTCSNFFLLCPRCVSQGQMEEERRQRNLRGKSQLMDQEGRVENAGGSRRV